MQNLLSKKLMLTLAMSLGVVATVEATTLKISHVRPQGTIIDKEITEFSSEVEQATDGGLNIRIYAANALGDYTSVQERISIGAIEMAVQPAAAAADRKMQISAFPYIAENWDQAREIYGPGGAIYEAMKELYAKQDITMLAAYPVYFGGIALNREAVSPGDVNVQKGVKVRVPAIKSFQLTGDALGYISSPIPFSEAFTAVQTGVVDGVIGSGAEGYYASFRDVTKTYIPMNTHFEVWYMIINSGEFASLDEEQRDALQQAALNFESKRWERAELDQADYENKLKESGATIVTLTDEELKAAAQKVRAEVWPVILNDIGAEWGQEILDQITQ